MKCKKTLRRYIIEDYPGKIKKLNRKKVDTTLNRLNQLVSGLHRLIHDTYENDPDLYWFIHDHIYMPDSYYLTDNDDQYMLLDTSLSISDLIKFLKEHDDDIQPLPVRLEDLGFKDFWFYHKPHELHVFEKTLEDSGEKEITEEVVINGDDIYRRKRTTVWEITPGCKSSKSIRYRKLPLTKKIKAAALNTKAAWIKKDEDND